MRPVVKFILAFSFLCCTRGSWSLRGGVTCPVKAPRLGQVRWNSWNKAMPACGSLTQGWRSSKTFYFVLSPNQQSHRPWHAASLAPALCSHLEVEVPALQRVVCGGAAPGDVQDQISASCPAVGPLAGGQEG